MNKIYVDECGYTGSDLLSDVQPFFVVSSLHLSDRQLLEWYEPLHGATSAHELKFSNLISNRRGRVALVAFVDSLNESQSSIKCSLFHKKYTLLAKLLDLVVEPMFHVAGQDFYENGFNVGLLNLLYFWFQEYEPQASLQLLQQFLAICRERGVTEIRAFEDSVEALFEQHPNFRNTLSPIMTAVQWRKVRGYSDINRSDLELHTAAVVSLIRYWNAQLSSSIAIDADRAKDLVMSQEYIQRLADQSLPAISEHVGNYDVSLPLRIVGDVNLVDSKCSIGVQLADVVAGLINHVALTVNRLRDPVADFSEVIAPIVAEWPRMQQVIPEAKFTPEQLGRVGFKGGQIIEATVKALRSNSQSPN